MLKIARKQNTVKLPSGPTAVVQELIGKHQRNLTEQRVKKETKINMLLSDCLVSVSGVPYESMNEAEKMEFVRTMLAADRKYILTEARQLAQSHNPVYHHRHEWKDDNGVKQDRIYEISLIDAQNKEAIIEKIKASIPDADDALLLELNRPGCFPTKPYLETYDSYAAVLSGKQKEFELPELFPGYKFTFQLMDGRTEESIKIEDLSSHTRILCRLLRYKENDGAGWKKVTREILDELPISAVDAIRSEMDRFEGGVDTVETFPNPDESKGGNITIDIVGEISFFFPSGKV